MPPRRGLGREDCVSDLRGTEVAPTAGRDAAQVRVGLVSGRLMRATCSAIGSVDNGWVSEE